MAAKRLIKELDQYNKDPSTAVLRLEPTSEDDIFHLTAVLRGPDGTAYEGKYIPSYIPLGGMNISFLQEQWISFYLPRRHLHPPPLHPPNIPQHATHNNFQDALLPSKRQLHHRRDLPRLAQDFLDACVWACQLAGSRAATPECWR